MDTTVSRGEQVGTSDGELSERDLYLVRMMLRTNTPWVLTPHNGHIVKIEPVGRPLHTASLPGWWIRYAAANSIELRL